MDCSDCKGHGISKGSSFKKCSKCHGSGREIYNRAGFTLYQTCKACSGQGQINSDPCKTCSGHGTRSVSSSINIDIPSGISETDSMSIKGAGNKQGNKAGDLHVFFSVQPLMLYNVF